MLKFAFFAHSLDVGLYASFHFFIADGDTFFGGSLFSEKLVDHRFEDLAADLGYGRLTLFATQIQLLIRQGGLELSDLLFVVSQ